MEQKEIKIMARLNSYQDLDIVYDIYLNDIQILYGYPDIISALTDLKLTYTDFKNN